MEKHPLQTVLEILEFDCFNYSGRGMYGRSCLAIKTEDSLGEFFAQFLGACVSCGEDSAIDEEALAQMQEAFQEMRQDNLGSKLLIYFPKVQFLSEEG